MSLTFWVPHATCVFLKTFDMVTLLVGLYVKSVRLAAVSSEDRPGAGMP